MKFDEFEESLLWRCMYAKICDNLDYDLSLMIPKYMDKYHGPLFRGVSQSTLNKMYDIGVGDTLQLNRVTSFSEDRAVACTFAATEYDTNTVIKLKGPVDAFHYSNHMLRLLEQAPDTKFTGLDKEKHRKDNIEMVVHEREWMIQSGSRLKVVSIEDYHSICTYTMELL